MVLAGSSNNIQRFLKPELKFNFNLSNPGRGTRNAYLLSGSSLKLLRAMRLMDFVCSL